MISSKMTLRSASIAQQASKRCRNPISSQKRCFRNGNRSRIATRSSPRARTAGFLLSVTIGGGCLYAFGYPRSLHAEAIPAPAELKFEERRRKASSREENRDLISSQHLQVKKSWENPGVYAWGNNTGRVVAPDLDEINIKTPRRISYFDGKIIRDIKLDRNFGAAITENGDLLQWGTAFSPDCSEPIPTLKGKNLVKLGLSLCRLMEVYIPFLHLKQIRFLNLSHWKVRGFLFGIAGQGSATGL
jgi:hypothetical protein